jgi:hypothetical protein
MKKSLLAIVFAAATLPLTFAQAAQATQSQPATGQKSTAVSKKAKKTPKQNTKKSSKPATSTTTPAPQK